MNYTSEDIFNVIVADKDLWKLQRCYNAAIRSYPNTHITLNSLNQEFLDEAEQWCKSENIPYRVTESNGTPSLGKNNAYDYYKEVSNAPWVVQMDGDDWQTPSSCNHLVDFLNSQEECDAICLWSGNILVVNDAMWQRRMQHPYRNVISRIDTGQQQPKNLYTTDNSVSAKRIEDTYNWQTARFGSYRPYCYKGSMIDKFYLDLDMEFTEDLQMAFKMDHWHYKGEMTMLVLDGTLIHWYDRTDQYGNSLSAKNMSPDRWKKTNDAMWKGVRGMKGHTDWKDTPIWRKEHGNWNPDPNYHSSGQFAYCEKDQQSGKILREIHNPLNLPL